MLTTAMLLLKSSLFLSLHLSGSLSSFPKPLTPEEEQACLEELWSLKPRDRDVIYLHYYEGYTIAEMAELLGENPNTVSARLGRARKKLKLLLEEGMCHG